MQEHACQERALLALWTGHGLKETKGCEHDG